MPEHSLSENASCDNEQIDAMVNRLNRIIALVLLRDSQLAGEVFPKGKSVMREGRSHTLNCCCSLTPDPEGLQISRH